MKKSIILCAIALAGFSFQGIANSEIPFENSISTEIKAASPFHLSIVKGDLATVQKLISLGSDVNEKWNGLTPAMYAARYNKTEILELLIIHGANLKAKCDRGHTALDYAKLSNATEAKEMITKALSTKKN